MRLAQITLAVVAASCAVLPGSERLLGSSGTTPGDVLPPATSSLSLALDAESTLAELLDGLARVTGQHVVMSEYTAALLTEPSGVLGGAVEVPADEVYPFVESILSFHHLYFAPLKGGQRPVLGVYSGRGPGNSRPPRVWLSAEELEAFAEHHALLVTTTVTLPNTDVRQLSTSLRAMLTDTNTQLLLPVGSSSLMLGGTAAHVAGLIETLQALDRLEGERQAERRRAQAADARTEAGPGGGDR